MGNDSPDNMESIQSVIGHAISSLLKSGKKLNVGEILFFLRQQEAQAKDGRKKVYGRAIDIITGYAK